MTLRSRLVVAALAVVVVLAVSLVVVARVQRGHLVGQVDRQLNAAGPFLQPFPATGGTSSRPAQPTSPVTVEPLPGEPPPEGPVSDLYFAELDDEGTTVVVIEGVLLDDRPDLGRIDTSTLDAGSTGSRSADAGRVRLTVPGEAGRSEFRVALQRTPSGGWVVLALPLDEVNDAVRRLVIALSVAAVLVLLAMALTRWVLRLGLGPVARMTQAAADIAAGRRDRRVEDVDPHTEVGRLGQALNAMLDERDRNEDKLRQFVADASHELRTPLTSIRGGLDLALDDDLPADRRDDVLRRVRGESRRMHDLVEDLLLLASLDSGRPLRREPVDLVAVVHDAADDARALQPDRAVVVDPAVPSEGSAPAIVVDGDEMRLRQVVAGLVHNALHHTPAAAGLRLAVRREPAGGVVLSVIDRGDGLTADQAAGVFDRFTRGDASRSRHAGGAGLGLAIARSVVEAHGGTLDLVTAPGEGCAFEIRLPVDATVTA